MRYSDLETTMTETERAIFSVSQLNRTAREVLEDCFAIVWVEGEISNLACPSSGHMYFSLKDKNAQVRCAMFRNRNQHLDFELKNGQHVIVHARVSLYEGRGEFQLVIETVEQAGYGALQRAFEQLKRQLDKQGLFNEKHKQPLPTLPKQIGLITSPTGAAVRDILSVLKRRFPAIPVIIYPTLVQGDAAAEQIAEMINLANRRQECDVLIIARGGGSLEDLWPFNEEIVAHAIFASKIPIISGVGHEIDFTIADFVADKRAPTPSAAAELISPDQKNWFADLYELTESLLHIIENYIYQHKIQINHLQKRLRHPGDILRELSQRLDHIEHRLNHAITIKLSDAKYQLQNLMRTLDTISPLATLNRGYAIVTEHETRQILRDAAKVNPGDKINAQLAKGELQCVVEST